MAGTSTVRHYVVGWALDPAQREQLLARFSPAYPNVIADHVTLASGVGEDPPLPTEDRGEIVGTADDGAGVQAMVVKIGGTTDRPDGSTYHITWSLGPGRKAAESNDVIRSVGWRPLTEAIPIRLQPRRFSH
jgi:hypothetical protein